MNKKISNIDNKCKLLNKNINYKSIKSNSPIPKTIKPLHRKTINTISIKKNLPRKTTVLPPIPSPKTITVKAYSLNKTAIGPSITTMSTIQQDNTTPTTKYRHPPPDINHLNHKRMNLNLKPVMLSNQEQHPTQMYSQINKTLRMCSLRPIK